MNIEESLLNGKYKEVVDHFITNPPKTAKEFSLFGIALFHLGLLDEAAKILEAGLTAFPNEAELLVNCAEVYYHKGEYQKAFEFAKMAILTGIEDAYLFDIIAHHYKNIGQKELSELFAEKAYQSFEKENPVLAEQVRVKYNIAKKKRKKILLIGSGSNYGDSLVKFVENEWELYVIKTDTWRSFNSNYEVFAELGAKLIELDEIDDFIETELKDIDLVFRTGLFGGGDDMSRSLFTYDIVQFNLIYKISSVIKQRRYKAKTLLAFNGDTFVHHSFWAKWLAKRLSYVDWILFDTNNLRRYFLKHVEIPTDAKTKVMLVEVPLKREVKVRLFDSYQKFVLTMGRDLQGYDPIPPMCKKSLDTYLAIGRGGGYLKRLKDRATFAEMYGNIAFGLGYFQDFYVANYSFEEILERSLENFSTTIKHWNYISCVYPYTNVPGKVITYLQFGIIPIVPDNGNDFYKALIENGMAIGIDRQTDYFEPASVSDKDITEMRKNIITNVEFFTFDRFYDFVNTEVMESGSNG